MTILVRFQLLLAVTTLMLVPILGFVPLGLFRPHGQHEVCRKSMTAEEVEEEEAGNALFEEEKPSYVDLDAHEKTWRHAKKPLLSIGSKGATHSHGNSLRQLLNDHTVVKVKVNTKKFGTF